MNIHMKKGNEEKKNIIIKNIALLLFPFLPYKYVYKMLNPYMRGLFVLVFTLTIIDIENVTIN